MSNINSLKQLKALGVDWKSIVTESTVSYLLHMDTDRRFQVPDPTCRLAKAMEDRFNQELNKQSGPLGDMAACAYIMKKQAGVCSIRASDRVWAAIAKYMTDEVIPTVDIPVRTPLTHGLAILQANEWVRHAIAWAIHSNTD